MSPATFAPDVPLPLDALAELHLAHGSHLDRSNGLCAMEIVAWLANEPHSDHPQCTCPALGAFCRSWNDTLSDDARDRLLKPLLPRLLNTRSTAAVTDRRGWMALDWLAPSIRFRMSNACLRLHGSVHFQPRTCIVSASLMGRRAGRS